MSFARLEEATLPTDATLEEVRRVEFAEARRKFAAPLVDVITEFVNDNTNASTVLVAMNDTMQLANATAHRPRIRGVRADDRTVHTARVRMQLVLKGGNLMRAYYNVYRNVVPAAMFDQLEQHYAECFRKSDIDFGIFLVDAQGHKLVPVNDTTNRQRLAITMYHMLHDFRNRIASAPHAFLHFFGASDRVRRSDMARLLESLDARRGELDAEGEEACLREDRYVGMIIGDALFAPGYETMSEVVAALRAGLKTVDDERQRRAMEYVIAHGTSGRTDQIAFHTVEEGVEVIEEDEDDDTAVPPTRVVEFHRLAEETSPLPITLHDQLRFANGPTGTVCFALGRLMLNVVILHRAPRRGAPLRATSLRGELVDIACTLADDHRAFVRSTIMRVGNVPRSHLFIFTLHALRADLHCILFANATWPWRSDKFAKRLVRLLFCRWLELLNGTGTVDEVAEALKLSVPVRSADSRFAELMGVAVAGPVPPEERAGERVFIRILDEFRRVLSDTVERWRHRQHDPFRVEDMRHVVGSIAALPI